MAKRRYPTRKGTPHTFQVVISLVVFLGIFLTVYVLTQQNTDVRSNADQSASQGIGQSVSEEVSSSVITITQPSSNAAVSSPVIIQATVASGQSIERVQFFTDSNKTPVNEVFAAPYETSVELSSGRHRVHAVVYDADGNAKRSQEVSFTVQ